MAIDYGERESFAVRKIKEAIPAWLLKDQVGRKGLFADIHRNDEVFPDHFLASATDTAGTKMVLAEAMHKFDTIGIDIVAMSANDLATLGQVCPFLFINCISCQAGFQEAGLTGELMKGIVKGLQQCDASKILRQDIRMNMGKGETASVDELLGGIRPGFGVDVAGAMIGFIRKEHMVEPEGDTLIALKSSGPHSNGYTSLRHTLLEGDFEPRLEFRKHYTGRFSLDDPFEESTIGEALLAPTRIYVKAFAAIAKEFRVYGFNNTGYGLRNLVRAEGLSFRITNPIEPLPIFGLVQREGRFSLKRMYEKFNMGQGFFILCRKHDSDGILSLAERYGESGKVIGRVEKGPTQVIFDGPEKFSWTGYA